MLKQKGFSFGGFMMVAIIAGFGLLLFLKVVPVYQEYFSIRDAVQVLNNEGAGKGKAEIRDLFNRKAKIMYITSVNGDHLNIREMGSKVKVTLHYEKIEPLIGNINLLFVFDIQPKEQKSVGG